MIRNTTSLRSYSETTGSSPEFLKSGSASELKNCPINLPELITSLCNSLLPAAQRLDTRIRVVPESGMPEYVTGVPVDFVKLMAELLLLAMEHCRQGFINLEVSLRADRDGEGLYDFDISCTGPGIDQELLDACLDPMSMGMQPMSGVSELMKADQSGSYTTRLEMICAEYNVCQPEEDMAERLLRIALKAASLGTSVHGVSEPERATRFSFMMSLPLSGRHNNDFQTASPSITADFSESMYDADMQALMNSSALSPGTAFRKMNDLADSGTGNFIERGIVLDFSSYYSYPEPDRDFLADLATLTISMLEKVRSEYPEALFAGDLPRVHALLHRMKPALESLGFMKPALLMREGISRIPENEQVQDDANLLFFKEKNIAEFNEVTGQALSDLINFTHHVNKNKETPG
ncbi:MAG: hypothetical protein V4543_04835 [Bacteroidota bacterium]